MITLKTPRGLSVAVPETDDEDPSPRFSIARAESAAEYYRENGYAILSGAIAQGECQRLNTLWEKEVKPSRSFIYRQATAKAERHVFNNNGWVMNPILNLQSLDPKQFPKFRRYATEKFLTAPQLVNVLRVILHDDPMIVQSMYFEGNSATWEHQDTYYLDSEKIGSMVGTWIALEDISGSAGRFFVCKGSHRIDMGLQGWANNIADHHEAYIESVVTEIRKRSLEIRAPKLNQGDVLVWNSRTIHGSLDSQDPNRSRQSVTLHAIPASHRFLQLQNRIVPLKVSRINGIKVHHPKDLTSFAARSVMFVESRFPGPFYFLKRLAIRALVKAKDAYRAVQTQSKNA